MILGSIGRRIFESANRETVEQIINKAFDSVS